MGTIAFVAMESTGVTADPLDIVIRSETGSAISLPVIQPECFGYSQTYNVPFTVGGTSVAPTIVDAAPSEYGVSVTVAQRGYLPKSMSKRSWFRVYSSDIRPLTDGAFAITFRQKDASGNVVTVLNATVPKVGLSAIECLAVCFQQIVPQLTETSLLPGASTGYTQDPPVLDAAGGFIRAGNRSEYLYLPHTVPDSVWEVLYTESADFLSRFSSPTYEPGWYGSGTGQNAVFTITLTKIDTVGYYSLEKTMLRIGGYPPVVDSIQGNDLDFAADTIATLYRGYAGNGGGATIAAPSAGQRSITVNWPATSNITNGLYTPGGPSKFITWKAQKSLGAGSGVSKLYGFRVTHGERVLDAAIPTLPWPTTSIPAGGGGGGGGGWGTLPADVIFAVPAEANGNDVAQFGLAASVSGTATIQASGSRTGDGYLRNTDGAQMADACFGYTPSAGFQTAWGAAQSMTFEFDIRYDTGGYLGGQILGIGAGYTALTSGGTTGVNLSGSPFAISAGSTDLTTGTWHHIAFVADYNGGSRVIRTYRDGVQQGAAEPVASFLFNDYPNPTAIGLLQMFAGFIGNGSLKGGLDNVVITTRAKYTSTFTPGTTFPEIVGYTLPPSNVDVTCAGYNDTDDVIGDGSFSVQATWPDAFFSAQVTLDDSTAASVFTIDGQSANFSSSRTLAAATITGTFTAAVPMTFDGAAAADDATQTASFYADVPLEFAGDSALEDIGQISVYTFIAPAEFYGLSDVEDATSSSDYALLDPVVYMLNKTVPAATLVSNIAQFYVDATVPAATLSAEISQYEGFKLDATVPAATGQAWFGMRLNSDVPRVALHAIGLVPNTLRLNATLPRVLLDAGALGGRVLRLTATVPAPSLSAWTGWRLMATTPAASSSGSIITGGAFRLTELVPAAVLSASSTQLNVLALNAVVPAAIRSGWLAITRTVPAARVTAHIAPVVAATRLAYSFTLSNSAMTRYPAYPFIQVLRMGNAYYGVGEDGLYELGGANDNGVAIPWSWETCMSDFGKAEKKTVVSAYLGGYVPQSMTYTIKVGDAPTGTNAHTTTATAVLRNHRQKFGIGRKSRFFAFGLSATQGQVAIESVEFEMASMSRRV